MKLLNRFIPWLLFTAFSAAILKVVYYYYNIGILPKLAILSESDKIGCEAYFTIYIILYTCAFLQMSVTSLFDDPGCCSDFIKPNFHFALIRCGVILIQAIFLSIIYFLPILLLKNYIIHTIAIAGLLYIIWLTLAVFSAIESNYFGFLWNSQIYIRELNSYYNDIEDKKSRLNLYLKNAKF